jgi:hypothetical protein
MHWAQRVKKFQNRPGKPAPRSAIEFAACSVEAMSFSGGPVMAQLSAGDSRGALRAPLWRALRVATGIGSLFVTLHAVHSAYGLDFRRDRFVSAFYCLVQFASFFVFLIVKSQKFEACLHATIAFGYLSAYSKLNWRTCMEHDYCTTVGSTVLQTFRTTSVLAAFGVFVVAAAALYLNLGPRGKPV